MDEEMKKQFEYMSQAFKAIRDKEGDKRRVVGTIPCPKCGKELRYSIASNGHVHGRCESGDLAWMQ
jgi:hypothetical protein